MGKNKWWVEAVFLNNYEIIDKKTETYLIFQKNKRYAITEDLAKDLSEKGLIKIVD